MKLEEIAIFTENVKKTALFYSALGGKVAYQNDCMAILQFENVKILVHATYEPKIDELPCENHIAFGASNVDLEVNRLETQGFDIEYQPKNYDWGRSAYLRDPNNFLVEISQVD